MYKQEINSLIVVIMHTSLYRLCRLEEVREKNKVRSRMKIKWFGPKKIN